MTTTLKPLPAPKPNQHVKECTRCFGTASQQVLKDGKKTKVYACVWCARSIEHGHLIVSNGRLIPPPKFRAKRGSES